MTSVLFVCLGNICRSPTAEGVFRKLLAERGLEGRIRVDSAGTGDWHVGEPPDARAQMEARGRGIDMSGFRGRQVQPEDFKVFDYVVAMDGQNLADLGRICPRPYRARLHRFTDFAPQLGVSEVPDPYYGGAQGFQHVFEIIEASAAGLLDAIEQAQREAG